MASDRWRVFLDTNVLIALVSRVGGSAAVLDLGEAEEIVIVISQQVLVEADRVLVRKFPQLIGQYREFIKNLAPFLAEDPSPQSVRNAGQVINLDDAPILAAAKQVGVDYLVTLNTRHFATLKVRAFLAVPIMTPAEFLTAFRRSWEGS